VKLLASGTLDRYSRNVELSAGKKKKGWKERKRRGKSSKKYRVKGAKRTHQKGINHCGRGKVNKTSGINVTRLTEGEKSRLRKQNITKKRKKPESGALGGLHPSIPGGKKGKKTNKGPETPLLGKN